MGFGDGPVYELNSASGAYVTPDQFFDFVDPDLPAQSLAPAGSEAKLTPQQLQTWPALLAILQAASGQVESAVIKGKLYSPESLAALAASQTVAGANLRQLVADIALYRCYSYRDGQLPPENVVVRYQEAERTLEQLRNGDEVFAFEQTQAAGLPESGRLTRAQVLQQNLVSSQWSRFFGTRQNLRGLP